MKIVLLNVEQAQSIYRSQMVRDFPESELKPFASVQGMMTRGLYEPLAFYDEAGALMAYAWQAVLPQCRNVLGYLSGGLGDVGRARQLGGIAVKLGEQVSQVLDH